MTTISEDILAEVMTRTPEFQKQVFDTVDKIMTLLREEEGAGMLALAYIGAKLAEESEG